MNGADEHEVSTKWISMHPFAVCSCGWEGPTREQERFAVDDARAHRRELLDGVTREEWVRRMAGTA